ncbi:NAD(P)H dehydrogenase (quinone) [Paenibacillus endophyticus]|uniref:NAD(P)H dehydrogenase (Quinone) n=1 Tax=Paenibacillus endophyticus TaxID=1294268 RepID=A0A7W5C645_9BACL|nr:NAD(P)H-dependent oxidoreductase [Paenibacillus endophyticus]MBB3151846.1 NAD(P)H dehydrogenase (quinone) [Paenibacillus endophyticus]
MNHLIVFAHPHAESFNHAILNTAVEALQSNGHEVSVRDLNKLGFNPVLTTEDITALREGNIPADIKTEQEFLAKADVVTFIYPIWWTGLPAILKGYVDRVFSYGFAYQYNAEGGIDKLLSGKKGLIVNTYGTPGEIYESIGMNDSLKQTSGDGIFEFSGIEVVDHLLFGGVTSPDANEARANMLDQVKRKFAAL